MPSSSAGPSDHSGRFSLIVATIGRTSELARLLKSIDQQTYRNFEVIIVDQNPDDRLADVLRPVEGKFPLRRITSPQGVSRARNLGLAHTTGDWIAFPDDDCWYGAEHLAQLAELFDKHPEWDGIVGHMLDERGLPIAPWKPKCARMTRFTAWLRSGSPAIFLRRTVVDRVGKFDELLGPGAGTPWIGGEDCDYVLRALELQFHIAVEPDVIVFHPPVYDPDGPGAKQKRYRYGRADGWRLRHRDPMPLWWTILFFLVPLARAAAALVTLRWNQAPAHWMGFKGRISGYFAKSS